MDGYRRAPYNEKNHYLGETSRVPLDLKSTVNLPKTDFPMKANLPQNEPKILERWSRWVFMSRSARRVKALRSMSLHDGPLMPMGLSIWERRSTNA